MPQINLREEERDGGRDEGREGEREGGRDGGREGGREGGEKEGMIGLTKCLQAAICKATSCTYSFPRCLPIVQSSQLFLSQSKVHSAGS